MKPLFFFLLCLLAGLQYKLWLAAGSIADVRQLKAELMDEQQKKIALLERNKKLSREVLQLKQGGEALEAHARLDLGMVKKGETYYQIVEQ